MAKAKSVSVNYPLCGDIYEITEWSTLPDSEDFIYLFILMQKVSPGLETICWGLVLAHSLSLHLGFLSQSVSCSIFHLCPLSFIPKSCVECHSGGWLCGKHAGYQLPNPFSLRKGCYSIVRNSPAFWPIKDQLQSSWQKPKGTLRHAKIGTV